MPAPTSPAQVTLRVPRWSPFDDTIQISGVDLSGATMLMQVRPYRDAPGAALINLATVAAPGEGVSVSVDTSGILPVSTVRIIINEPTIEGLPFGANPGADVPLKWDMLISKTGMKKARWFEGDFIVTAGVTQV